MSDRITPLDASILAVLAQVPKQLDEGQRSVLEQAQQRLLNRLSDEAREIGQAVLADDGAEGAYSPAAQETAGEMKRWAVANNSR